MALGCLFVLLTLTASIGLTNTQELYENGLRTNASIEFAFTTQEEAIYRYVALVEI